MSELYLLLSNRPFMTSLNLSYSEIMGLTVGRRDMLLKRLIEDWEKEAEKK